MATPTPAPHASPTDIDARGQFLGHPAGLFLLFLVEMWERFSFYGMKAILGLYLKCKLTGMDPLPDGAAQGFNPGRGWAKDQANNLQGWYAGMAYLLPIAGGLIADKLIGTHKSMVVGGLLIALGHIVLAISGMGTMATTDMGMNVFVLGLALIVIGTGHFKPSVSVMVNQLYAPSDPRRDGAFSIFYMGINVGAFLGVMICAYLGERVGWHYGFGAAAIGMLAGLVLYVFARPRYLAGIGLPAQGNGNQAIAFLFGGMAAAVGFAALYGAGALGVFDRFVSQEWVTWALLLAGIVAAVIYTMRQEPQDRGPVGSIFIFMVFNTFFWLAFEQSDKSIGFFIDEKTDRNVGSFLVPAGWFQNINPFCIVLLAPVFGLMWTRLNKSKRSPSQPVKIGIGLIFVGLGYLFMVLAGMQAKDTVKASLWFVAATFVMHTIGELFLSPTGLSYVTKAAPKKSVSLLMGIWFLSSFLAHVIGGKIAGATEKFANGQVSGGWFFWRDWFGGQGDFFFLFVVLCVGSGLLIFILSPFLKRMMRNPND